MQKDDLRLLADGLGFPKGVALSAEEDRLVVSVALASEILEFPLVEGAKGFSYLAEDLFFHPAGLHRTSNSKFAVIPPVPMSAHIGAASWWRACFLEAAY